MYYRLPRLDLWRTLSWVVILSSLRLEWICSLRGLGTFADTSIVSWGSFRVLDDFGHGQNFGLVWLSLSSLDVSCHEFCTGFIFAAWRVYGFYAQKPLWSVLQLCEESCMFWQLDVGVFCKLTQVCIISFLSETSRWNWLHIAFQDVRHASWGNSECGLYGSVDHLLRCEARTLGWEKTVVFFVLVV